MVLPFVGPLGYVCASAGPEETKNQRGEILRLIQIRLTTPSLAKISATCQINSVFLLRAQRSASRRSDKRQQFRLFVRETKKC
jgi:hypothetical protein